MSPEIASRVIARFQQIRPSEKADYHLTPHEVRLLKLLAEGHSYKSAAAALQSSVNTVGFHMRNIYTKLQVHSESEAVAKGAQTGGSAWTRARVQFGCRHLRSPRIGAGKARPHAQKELPSSR
jgi:DNA-binding NarL/FixJ family response regulator